MDFINELHNRLLVTRSYVDQLKQQLDQLMNVYSSSFNNWTDNCSRLISATCDIQKHTLDKCLFTGGHRSIFNDNQLNAVQPLIELLGQIWIDLRAQLISFASFSNIDCQKLKDETETMLEQLIRRTFVIVLQPPQVIKTNQRFNTMVRSLTGAFVTSTSSVRAHILNGNQARVVTNRLQQHHIITSGIIVNWEAVLHRNSSGHFVANFDNMSIKKISRSEKKGPLSVMDEKFAITFITEVTCAGQLKFNIQTLSVPVVVIVHGTQETNAMATIIWDNHFAYPTRLPFVVPEKVSWSVMGKMLSDVFLESTGCQLGNNDLQFLLEKVFRVTNSYSTSDLSWYQFAKEPLPGLRFTFWEWFHSVIKLTREQLTTFWTCNCRLVSGFISRHGSTNALKGRPDGTFLLRFSETSLGCLSIAYKDTNKFNQQVIVNLSPFSSRDLTIRSLGNRLKDLTKLKYLLPDIPKDTAFGAFYDQPDQDEPQSMNYKKISLVTQVLEWTQVDDSQMQMDSIPYETQVSEWPQVDDFQLQTDNFNQMMSGGGLNLEDLTFLDVPDIFDFNDFHCQFNG